MLYEIEKIVINVCGIYIHTTMTMQYLFILNDEIVRLASEKFANFEDTFFNQLSLSDIK